MTVAREYPPVFCAHHTRVEFVDVLEQDGSISHACPECVPVELVNVVRQLFKRKEPG